LRDVLLQYRVPGDEEELPTSNMVQQFYDCLIQSIDAVKAWADRVPGFSELCKHDQDQLFQSAALELVMLRIAYTCRSAPALSRYSLVRLLQTIKITTGSLSNCRSSGNLHWKRIKQCRQDCLLV